MRTAYFLITIFLALPTMFVKAQDCTGSSTIASEGSFTIGYNYSFTTSGTDVTATFELLDPRDGLIAFAQTYNPNFAELPMSPVGPPENQTFSITFPNQTIGDNFLMACKFAFAGGLSTTNIIGYTVGEGCTVFSGGAVSLPITFEEAIDYELVDFGGNESIIVADPTDASNTVVQSTKTLASQTFAGTTVADVTGFDAPIPFAPGETIMTVRVWSPLANIPVRLKVEQVGLPTISVETEATVTVAGEWQTLTFNFANQAGGTAALNFASVYNKASIFFNFGTPGVDTGEQIYYWDDVTFGNGVINPPVDAISLPITFEEAINYELVDFGGNASQIVTDPTDAGNSVVQSTKTLGAELWAGTTVADVTGFDMPIAFAAGETQMTVRVWSPLANIPIRLKVEQVGNPTISVETEATITAANEWQTLVFDFAVQAPGTAAINFANVYNKASIFFNFGTPGAITGEQTYFWDDVTFEGGGTPPPPVDVISLPITFEEAINYELVDFGGNASQIVTDPTDAGNSVVQSTKTLGAELWAGTTVADVTGFDMPIAFAAGETQMTVRVWSPLANIPIRLKVEQVGNPTISVETEATITAANEWQTLVFDFAVQAPGTAAINFANVYNKASIFFNFGTPGAITGEQTYFWDDVTFIGSDLPGCTDPTALNYNPAATIDDGSCEAIVFGCTDPTAFNYDANANADHGGCIPVQPGCTDAAFDNYNPYANTDDDSCANNCAGDINDDGVINATDLGIFLAGFGSSCD